MNASPKFRPRTVRQSASKLEAVMYFMLAPALPLLASVVFAVTQTSDINNGDYAWPIASLAGLALLALTPLNTAAFVVVLWMQSAVSVRSERRLMKAAAMLGVASVLTSGFLLAVIFVDGGAPGRPDLPALATFIALPIACTGVITSFSLRAMLASRWLRPGPEGACPRCGYLFAPGTSGCCTECGQARPEEIGTRE